MLDYAFAFNPFINCIKLYAGEIPSKDGKIILDTGNLALSN
jgi:hypothetical protein